MEQIKEPTRLQREFVAVFPCLTLASSSPNRKALLEKGGSKVLVFKPMREEISHENDPRKRIEKLAMRKMEEYLESDAFNPSLPAITADTMVLFNESLIGKPKDKNDAMRILKTLSGRRHEVITSAVLYFPSASLSTVTDSATVYFKRLIENEIRAYLLTGDWLGAAGAYRLQRNGYKIIEKIEGDWTTVVGLPLDALIKRGVSLRNAQSQA